MNLTEKNKLLDKISIIVMMGIFAEFFLYAVDYSYTDNLNLMQRMPTILNVVGLIFLAISVFIFVRSYQKNHNNNLIYAIEFLALAIMCPFMTYWYIPKYFGLTTNWIHSINHHVMWVVVALYYIGRIGYEIYKSYSKSSQNNSFKKKKIKE